MALDRKNTDRHYNIGRLTAVIQLMNDLDVLFTNRVSENPKQALDIQVRDACRKQKHVLYDEFMNIYEILFNEDFESQMMKPVDCGRFFIGCYHEKKYISDTYPAIGNVSTTVQTHEPDVVSVLSTTNEIPDLHK